MIKAKLLKPLDGRPEGAEIELDTVDFEALATMNAVERAGAAKTDAPLENKSGVPAAAKRRG